MSEQPKFRIQSVAELTGVPAATLRAWEKRYGVPAPTRTAGAYRLYAAKDVERVLRMRDLCAGGMAAAQAADEVRHAAPLGPLAAEPPDGFAALSARIVQAAHAMDVNAIEETLASAMTLGSASELYQRVLAPSLVKLGELWHNGELSIGHEHLATELLTGAAAQWLRLVQPKSSPQIAVLACFAEETHALPLYGVGFALAEWGCRSALLGPRTPPSGLAAAVHSLKPCFIGLSVTIAPKLSAAESWLDGYAQAAGGVPWVVGGAGASPLKELIEQRGGQLAPREPREIHRLFEQLLTRRRK